MAVTLIIASADAATIEVGLSPLAELVAHLHALTEREHHQGATTVDPSGLSNALLEDIQGWSPLWAAYRGRFLLPAGASLGRRLPDELAAMADLPMQRFAEHAGYAIRGGNSGPALDRLLQDADQQQQLRRAARLRSTARTELADRLLDSPQTFRTDLLDFLSRYAVASFDAAWEGLRPLLLAEVHRMRVRVRDRGVAAALAELSPSAQLLDGPRRVVFDKLRSGVARLDRGPSLVIPSRFGEPHMLIKHEPGWPVLIQYGLAARGGHEASLALLRARLRALADPARIRICRLIAREALTTTELSARSGMTEPQVSRHLRQLRDVELVFTERDGRMVHYRLDLSTVRTLGADLELAVFR
jgi:DNA-binding transcriptional ArsR family regulator